MNIKPSITRAGPVHFQPLEWELAPVSQYLKGHMLNAGCGNRDIGAYLRSVGTEKSTNYDIVSGLPDAVIGPLEAMPFCDGQFDSALCNAVLEHVVSAAAVVKELFRVIRPGGHAVLAVPFLQPYHECPLDRRRYTGEGLAAVSEQAGFKVVTVLPVHSAAQTLGWIGWEIAREKGPLTRAMAWPIIWLATRISLRTDKAVIRNANTYQVVLVRP